MKYLIIAIVIIVIAGGGYFIMKHQQAVQPQTAPATQTQQNTSSQSSEKITMTTAPSTASASSNAVSYTSNGFEPQTVTIKKGQAVTWTNKDSDEVWIASNPHPTHTDYPGFDELKSMTTGQTYSFTFTKVGKWGYHNHLNPSQHGIVVVTE